jgi:hypothetical protein
VVINILKPSKSSSNLTDVFLVIFAILFGVAIFAHAYIGLFTRYMADDYCTAAAVHHDGLLGLQKSFYLGWSGRFSFNFAIAILALQGPRIVPVLPAAALCLMLVVLTWTISCFGSIYNWPRRLLISFVLAELIVFVTVSDNRGGVYESLYWQTGMLTYWFPLVFMVAYVGFVKQVDGLTGRLQPGPLYLLIGVVLPLIAGGFNETFAVFQMCGMLAAIGWSLWARRLQLLKLLVAGFIGSVAATAIVYVAPGNHVRRTYFPPSPDWLTLLKWLTQGTFNFLFAEQNYPGTYSYRALALLTPALLAIYAIPRKSSSPRDFGSEIKKKWLTIGFLPLIGFAIISSCFVPAMYVTSKQPPPRALVIPQFVLISLLVVWSYYLGHLLRYGYLESSRRRFPLLTGVSLVLAAALVLAPIKAARRTFSNAARFRALALLWDKQDQEIRGAKAQGETDLTIPLAYNIGRTDIMTADPQWYVNQCVAGYYDVKTIIAKPSAEGLKILSNVPVPEE